MGGGAVDLRLCQSAKKSTRTTTSLIYDFLSVNAFYEAFLRVSSPLLAISPVRRRHFTLTNILGMSCFEAGPFLLHRSTLASLGSLNGHLWAYTFLTIGADSFKGGGSAGE